MKQKCDSAPIVDSRCDLNTEFIENLIKSEQITRDRHERSISYEIESVSNDLKDSVAHSRSFEQAYSNGEKYAFFLVPVKVNEIQNNTVEKLILKKKEKTLKYFNGKILK